MIYFISLLWIFIQASSMVYRLVVNWRYLDLRMIFAIYPYWDGSGWSEFYLLFRIVRFILYIWNIGLLSKEISKICRRKSDKTKVFRIWISVIYILYNSLIMLFSFREIGYM